MKKDSEKYLLSCGILEKWHNLHWENFTGDTAAKNKCLAYIDAAEENRKKGIGLWLYGPNGTGKSLSLNSAFKDLIAEKYKVKIVSMATLVSMQIDGWNGDEEAKTYLQRVKQVDFLGIEEVGKEMRGKADTAVFVLDSILRYRCQRLRPTWATSNLPVADMAQIYPDKADGNISSIASMLREMCIPVKFKGEDYRKKIAEKL